MKKSEKISFIIPMYNESAGVRKFHTDLLLPVVENVLKSSYEIIYVNDGSTDDTLEILTSFANKNPKIKVVNLSRNFGKEIATTAGIHLSSGSAVIIMDGDGQHPPDIIPEFLEKWRQGSQVVIGIRNSNTKEGLVKKWGSKAFYKLFNYTSGAEIIPRSTDYRLIDEVVRREFILFSERQRITRGLIDWLGFKRGYVTFNSPARIAGEASYKTGQLIKLAVNSFVSLSLKPLFMFGWMGIIITLASLFTGVAILVEQFLLGDPLNLNITGSAMLGIFTSFLVGLVLISQGMIAIYLSHVHAQTQNRPLFVVDPSSSKNITDNASDNR